MSRFWEFAHLSDEYRNASWFDGIPLPTSPPSTDSTQGTLFLGGLLALHQPSPSSFSTAKITHIVSVIDYDLKAAHKVELESQGVKRLWIDIEDFPSENLLRHFARTNAFIEDAFHNNGNVFVHCAMGVSRSATIVCAYLMWKYRLSAHEAYKIVKKARPRVNPNAGFHEQLKVYGRMLDLERKAEMEGAKNVYAEWVKAHSRQKQGPKV